MKKNGAAFLSGFLFAIGLAISGMVKPSNVLGFLDIFRDWKPALLFVMIGAILVHAVAYFFIKGKKRPLFDSQFHIPQRKDITPHLIIGSLIFGVGWGVGGYCPGPALVAMATFQAPVYIFLISMLLGMFLFRFMPARIKRN